MNIKTVIVDDEAPALRRIKNLLLKHSDFKLVGEADNGTEAIEVINSTSPNFLILDVQLKDMLGFDVLKKIEPIPMEIVFITAYDEFAIRAFEKGAIDYLLKPYKEDRFQTALNRILKRFKEGEASSVYNIYDLLSSINYKKPIVEVIEGKTTHLIKYNSLIYIKADGYHCNFHYEFKEKKMIRVTLKEVETILPENFVRVGRSYILNLDKLKSYKKLNNSIEVELFEGGKFSFNGVNADKLYKVIIS